MAQAEALKKTRRWWGWLDSWVKRTAAIVALLAAAYGLVVKVTGHELKTPGDLILVTDTTVIENQYLQVTGQPLTDPATKDLIKSAVNLAKASQYEESRKRFQQLTQPVPVPAVFNNVGALDAEKGDKAGAKEAYTQALAKQPDYQPALQNLRRLATFKPPPIVKVKGQESEPNNDFDHANEISVGDSVMASIADASDEDFYAFTTPAGSRDHYQVSIKNGGLTLHPWVGVYDGNRHRIGSSEWSPEALAEVDANFSAEARSTYYVQVLGSNNTSGAYVLSVKPLKLYDRFEPNDDFPQATSIPLGAAIEANIMDAADADFYVVKAPASGQLMAKIENLGTTLHPWVGVYNGNRHRIGSSEWSPEALAEVDANFSAEAGSTYYVQVLGSNDTSGAYKLTVK